MDKGMRRKEVGGSIGDSGAQAERPAALKDSS